MLPISFRQLVVSIADEGHRKRAHLAFCTSRNVTPLHNGLDKGEEKDVVAKMCDSSFGTFDLL